MVVKSIVFLTAAGLFLAYGPESVQGLRTSAHAALASWWQNVEAWCGSAFFVYVPFTIFYTNLLFWAFNVFFLALDFLEPKWAKQFKIQEKESLALNKFLGALPRILFNEYILSFGLSYLAWLVLRNRGGGELGMPFPTLATLMRDLVVCIICEEIGFYYSHRLFHVPFFYKRVHKIHHEWTAPIGITAVYAHPLEHTLSNVLPVASGPMLMVSHPFTILVWYSIALLSTSVSHSGYHLPFFPSPEAHDFHHLAFTQCYGVLGILDYLHGTDKSFRRNVAFRRHFTSMTLTPVKVQFPENKEK